MRTEVAHLIKKGIISNHYNFDVTENEIVVGGHLAAALTIFNMKAWAGYMLAGFGCFFLVLVS